MTYLVGDAADDEPLEVGKPATANDDEVSALGRRLLQDALRRVAVLDQRTQPRCPLLSRSVTVGARGRSLSWKRRAMSGSEGARSVSSWGLKWIRLIVQPCSRANAANRSASLVSDKHFLLGFRVVRVPKGQALPTPSLRQPDKAWARDVRAARGAR